MDQSTTPDLSQAPLGVFPPGFANALLKEVRGQLPTEKMRERLKQVELWKQMQAAGSVSINGIGQKIGTVSARTFFRWHREFPGCWNDPGFVKRMLKDNPQMCAPGYRPDAAPKFL